MADIRAQVGGRGGQHDQCGLPTLPRASQGEFPAGPWLHPRAEPPKSSAKGAPCSAVPQLASPWLPTSPTGSSSSELGAENPNQWPVGRFLLTQQRAARPRPPRPGRGSDSWAWRGPEGAACAQHSTLWLSMPSGHTLAILEEQCVSHPAPHPAPLSPHEGGAGAYPVRTMNKDSPVTKLTEDSGQFANLPDPLEFWAPSAGP